MKTVKIKSAIPIYLSALIWILFGLFSPIYELLFIFLAAGASMAVYLVSSVFIPGRTVEVFDPAKSGDAQVDRQIEEGRQALLRIKEANLAIVDETISRQIGRMEDAGQKVFEALERDVQKASQVRKFMNYYLPTADALLSKYRTLKATNATGENIASAMKSIENSMEMIAQAFERQLDALYKDEALDIQTDIDVLETMLKSDNLADTKNGGTTL